MRHHVFHIMTHVIDQRRFLATGFGESLPYWKLDLCYRRGVESGTLGTSSNPYTGAEAVAWLRGYCQAHAAEEQKH